MKQEFPFQYKGRQPGRADGIARRKAILNATQTILIREGIRGVTHRTVAEEAQVPLAATTYYFKELTDLIHDSFLYFAEKTLNEIQHLEQASFAVLQTYLSASENANPEHLKESLLGFISRHIEDQVANREERLLEHTFRIEALRNQQLAEVFLLIEQYQLNSIQLFLNQLGIEEAEGLSQHLFTMMQRMEYLLMIDPGANSLMRQSIAQVLDLFLLSSLKDSTN